MGERPGNEATWKIFFGQNPQVNDLQGIPKLMQFVVFVCANSVGLVRAVSNTGPASCIFAGDIKI